VADFKVGDIIDGTVTKLVNFGAFVRVRDGLEGLIHISELSHQRVAHPGDVVHEGQQLKLKIISLESERHRLGLSLKQAEEPPARPAPEPGQPAGPRPERRPRQERSYSMSDAIQEPEGGIDNTLASAFAQVREQLAAAGDDGDVPAATESSPTAEASAAAEEAPAAEAETRPTAEVTPEPVIATGPDTTIQDEATAAVAEEADAAAEPVVIAEPEADTESEKPAEAAVSTESEAAPVADPLSEAEATAETPDEAATGTAAPAESPDAEEPEDTPAP